MTPYHVSQGLYDQLDLPAGFPLDALCVYAVYADGACAEGASAELYRRFMKAPEETLEYIATLADWNIPCRGTATSIVCDLMVFDGYYFDTVQERQTPFLDTLKELREKYTEGNTAAMLDLLEAEYRRSEEQEKADAQDFQEWREGQT